MADNARVIEVLEEWEGRENDKYNDHLGNPTIGVGHKMTGAMHTNDASYLYKY